MDEPVMGVSTTSTEVVVSRHFSVGPAGLVVYGTPSYDQWEELCLKLRAVETGIQFAIGDALCYGEKRFGERASQIEGSRLGWSFSTCQVYRWVARQVPYENRHPELSYSHHQEVAALTHSDQRKWLAAASAGDDDGPWPVTKLKAALKAGEDSPSAWYLVVRCRSQGERAALEARLLSEGFQCKTSEKSKTKP